MSPNPISDSFKEAVSPTKSRKGDHSGAPATKLSQGPYVHAFHSGGATGGISMEALYLSERLGRKNSTY